MKKEIININVEDLSLEIVDLFFSKIREISKEKEKENDKVYIALSGGNSLLDFYKKLKSMARYLEKEYWEKIIFCFADERIVPLDNKDSNYLQLKNVFLDKLIEENFISKKQIISINPEATNLAQDYSNKIPQVDIVLLGSGPDGHIASLFPKHNSIKNEESKFIIVENSPKPPTNRVSMSSKMFSKVIVSFIFFIDEEKRDAFIGFRDESLESNEFPNKLSLNAKECFIVSNLKV